MKLISTYGLSTVSIYFNLYVIKFVTYFLSVKLLVVKVCCCYIVVL